jgi:hypothetical protein
VAPAGRGVAVESDQTNPTRQPSEQGSSRATEQAVEQDQRVRRDGVEPPSTDLNELRPDIEDARTKPSTEQRGSDTVATSTRSDGQDELDLGLSALDQPAARSDRWMRSTLDLQSYPQGRTPLRHLAVTSDKATACLSIALLCEVAN